jgi:hypothetical protein
METSPHARQPKAIKIKLAWGAKRGHQARVHSDQMVLIMDWHKAEPHERWLKYAQEIVGKQL